MRKLAIVGASGHGKVVADTALQSGWESVHFFDDAWPALQLNGSWPVLGDTDALLNSVADYDGVAVAIGNNRIRLEKAKQLLDAGMRLPFLVHPRAYVASDVVLGAGVVIFAGAVVQPGSKIDAAGIVNTGATVDHDCFLSAGAHICPGANVAGGVAIGECGWVGTGSIVKQNARVGSNAVVGAGAVVIGDVEDGATVVGVPARPI